MATKVLNTRYQIVINVKHNGSLHLYMSYDFDNKTSMLTWIKRFENVQGSTNDYEIIFNKVEYNYDDETKRITKTTTALTAEDL